jgi:uncharacterized phosphosugar-binding protein
MNSAQLYINEIKRLVEAVEATQGESIEKAAGLIADALAGGGYVFTFGTGHSHILAEEIFYRAGGLVRVCPILEDSLMLHRAAAASSQLERVTGLASVLLDDVDAIKMGGVMFLFSNSGCNTVAVEMAEEAHKRGLATVCITNLTHAARSRSRHPEGRKLCEVCDVVIDNKGCYGDAAITVGDTITGATSTAIGAMILQAAVCRGIQIAQERGADPEVFQSANTVGGDEANEKYINRYKAFIRSL